MTKPKYSSSISAAASSLAAVCRVVAALALVFALASPAMAQTGDGARSAAGQPVGVVDMAAILQQSNAIAQIREAIDEKTVLFQKEISQEEVAIREVEAKLNEDKDLITEEEFNARVAEFEERVVALQQEIQQQRNSFDRAYADAQRRLEEQLLLDVAAQERESIEEMRQRGLTVVEIDDAGKAAFRAVAAEMTASWRGDLIPADIYDLAVEARDAFRAGR